MWLSSWRVVLVLALLKSSSKRCSCSLTAARARSAAADTAKDTSSQLYTQTNHTDHYRPYYIARRYKDFDKQRADHSRSVS